MPEASSPTFPASQALQIVTLVKRWNVAAADLLADTGLTELDLEQAHARISFTTLSTLVERARALTGEPGIGIYLGLQKQASMYGYLGFAAMTASTVREALELAVRFTPVLTSAVSLALEVEGERASLVICEHADMGSTRDAASFSLVVGLLHLFWSSMDGSRQPSAVDFTFAEPEYFPRFRHLIPSARFSQPVMRILFDASLLDVKVPTGDRAALSLAREACERQLAALGFDRTLAARVQRLVGEGGTVRSVEEVARTLGMSTRTLKRKLAAEGTSFSLLMEGARRRTAVELLEQTELSLDEIVDRLGYSSAPNFVRAFRRWTGMTPASYRRDSRANR